MQGMSTITNSSFLDQDLSTGNIPGLIGIIVCSAVLAILYEGLNFFIEVQQSRNKYKENEHNFHKGIVHVALSALHIVRVFTGCLLVLAIVTYNVWVLVTICVSAGIGYYIVRSHLLKILCRRRRTYQSEIDDQLLFYRPADSDTDLLVRDLTPNPDECLLQDSESTPLTPANTLASGYKTSVHEMNSDERWVFIRETFQRASRRRLMIMRENKEVVREQMGGINDTFGTEDCLRSIDLNTTDLNDTYFSYMSDLENNSATKQEDNLTLTMYISVV